MREWHNLYLLVFLSSIWIALCTAEAVFYHGPNLCLEYHKNGTRVVKSTRRQLAVLMTMESAAYYPCFDDPVFMQPFDLEISYRREVRALWDSCPYSHT